MQDHLAYFEKRLAAERESAADAGKPEVAAVHAQLAARYEGVLRAYGRLGYGPTLSLGGRDR
jgi:hypothetical protein